MTNLEQEKFSSKDIEHIFQLRWDVKTKSSVNKHHINKRDSF
jgi:hypothetical protein